MAHGDDPTKKVLLAYEVLKNGDLRMVRDGEIYTVGSSNYLNRPNKALISPNNWTENEEVAKDRGKLRRAKCIRRVQKQLAELEQPIKIFDFWGNS